MSADPRFLPLPGDDSGGEEEDGLVMAASRKMSSSPPQKDETPMQCNKHQKLKPRPSADMAERTRTPLAHVTSTSAPTLPNTNPTVAKSASPTSSIVKLNIGGCKFTTSRATLCRFHGTHLESMFSGRHANPTDIDPDDGSYFIDRDGTHFRHILNFLRVGYVVSLPEGALAREELAEEADFYGLDALVKAIRKPPVDVASHLPPDMVRIREEEVEIRHAFSSDMAGGKMDRHQGLVSLFPDAAEGASIDPTWMAPLKYDKPELPVGANGSEAKHDDGTSDVVLMPLRGEGSHKGQHVTCDSLFSFRNHFNRQHPNVLHRLEDIFREEPIIIAGGSVLRALTSDSMCRTAEWWGSDSDVDLFIYGVDSNEATRIARRVFYALAVDEERWGVIRSRGVLNIHQQVNQKFPEKIQIVLRIYDSPAEVLYGFDADCCCCAFDGKEVWVTKRFIFSLRNGRNTLNPLHSWPNKASYELRLAKYAYRGFSVLVPGLDKNRVDIDRIRRSDLGDLQGLARLLKVSHEMESTAAVKRSTRLWWMRANPARTDTFEARVTMPNKIPSLSKQSKESRSDDENLVGGMGGYDDGDLGGYVAIIPPVFYTEGDEVPGAIWYDNSMIDIPTAINTRDEGWEYVLNCDSPPEGIPGRLVDAWDTEKRSREYLNGKMDGFDLDNLYYSQAYKD